MASFAYYRSRRGVLKRFQPFTRVYLRAMGSAAAKRYILEPVGGDLFKAEEKRWIVSSMPYETARGCTRHKTYAAALAAAKLALLAEHTEYVLKGSAR